MNIVRASEPSLEQAGHKSLSFIVTGPLMFLVLVGLGYSFRGTIAKPVILAGEVAGWTIHAGPGLYYPPYSSRMDGTHGPWWSFEKIDPLDRCWSLGVETLACEINPDHPSRCDKSCWKTCEWIYPR